MHQVPLHTSDHSQPQKKIQRHLNRLDKSEDSLVNLHLLPNLHGANVGCPPAARQRRHGGLPFQAGPFLHASPPSASDLWLVALWPLTPIRTISLVYLHSGGRCRARTRFLELCEPHSRSGGEKLRSASSWLRVSLSRNENGGEKYKHILSRRWMSWCWLLPWLLSAASFIRVNFHRLTSDFT